MAAWLSKIRLDKKINPANSLLEIVGVAVLFVHESVNYFSVTSTNLTVLSLFFACLYGSYAHGAFMSTLAEISGIPFLLCLILGVAKHFATQFSAREWSAYLPDFIELMVMWAVYVWLSNLFGSRITCLDESDAINLLAIFLVCLSVALFGGKDDQTFHP